MSWKTAVYDYIHAKNRAEAEFDTESLNSALSDALWLREHRRMLTVARKSSSERGVKPIQHETKLRILGTRQTSSWASADLELHRIFSYELLGQNHTEERIERERVTLVPHKGRWIVAKVERMQPPDGKTEPTPATVNSVFLSRAWDAESESVFQSVPYLNNSILNPQETSLRSYVYNRQAAVRYAETWWNAANPQYIEFEVDCTSFVSQCLYAGGIPMDYTGKRESGWWYRGKSGGQELWSYSWAVANSLPRYLLGSGRARLVGHPAELRPGDVICYDWDGDGRWQHNTLITSLDASGMPLVNAHTYNARARYWAYHDSPAYTERTAYMFLRITDRK